MSRSHRTARSAKPASQLTRAARNIAWLPTNSIVIALLLAAVRRECHVSELQLLPARCCALAMLGGLARRRARCWLAERIVQAPCCFPFAAHLFSSR